MIEVGTGAGLLTHALAETGAEIVSFEVDEGMLEVAKALRSWPDRVTFVAADVLRTKHEPAEAFDAALAVRPDPPGRLLLVSNLPYGAGTPILLGVLTRAAPPDDVVVMLQREVVEKLLAPAGTKAYGAPSVVVGLNARGEVLRRFGPEVFWPRPRVQSAVARLTPVTPRPLRAEEQGAFGAFVTALFSHRRKVLPSALRLAGIDAASERTAVLLEGHGLSPKARVGEAAPMTLLDLWRALGRP